ncbi:MAG TPA: prepilin-type N-terminal cleavage/methylation domain-containing protein [Gemmatimonadales bacterium]|nr:prepilin-type N-terminal cleavage/methylation domain-containing protein [Gemmatimonadales bacterium]
MLLTPRRRAGFTLVELMVGIVLVGLVGLTLMRVVVSSQRISQAQTAQADMQANVRTAALMLPAELREIGYDFDAAGVVRTDLVDAQATSLRTRVMRGWGVICGNYDVNDIRVRLPLVAYRNPTPADSFLLFLENEHNRGDDDQWVPFHAAVVDPDSDCGTSADRALRLSTLTGDVLFGGAAVDLTTGMPLQSRILNGGPIRFFEVMEYGLYEAGGRAWLGARSLTAGEAAYEPVIGPLRAGNGMSLRYLDRDEAVVPPNDPTRFGDIRMIELTLRAETGAGITGPGGFGARGIQGDTLVTRVAVRNLLRP